MTAGYVVLEYDVLRSTSTCTTVPNKKIAPGRSGKIRFLLVASTWSHYQAEVRCRTFQYLYCRCMYSVQYKYVFHSTFPSIEGTPIATCHIRYVGTTVQDYVVLPLSHKKVATLIY
jgi:hypothetical protein